MATKKLDAELVLRKLAEMRRSIPFLEQAPPRAAGDGRMTAKFPLETAEDFEIAAVVEGLRSFTDDLSAAVEKKRAKLEADCLEIYYAAEELSRDPEHAHLIPHVERMRAAYQKDHGRPIPPRKKE